MRDGGCQAGRFNLGGTRDEDYVMPNGMKFSRPRRDHEERDGPMTEDDSDFDPWDNEYQDWQKAHRVLTWPEPEIFATFSERLEKRGNGDTDPVDLQEQFGRQGLQVIFKLANIHLPPDKPVYGGGSWYVCQNLRPIISSLTWSGTSRVL
jgi:hypothetical protein